MRTAVSVLLINHGCRDSLVHSLETIVKSSSRFDLRSRKLDLQPRAAVEDQIDEALRDCDPGVVLLALCPRLVQEAVASIRSIRARVPEAPVLVFAEDGQSDDILRLLQQGATDFIAGSLTEANILPRIWRLLEFHDQGEGASLRHLKVKLGTRQMVGRSGRFVREMRKIPMVAQCDEGVLLCGETGTGKELFARAIHYLSPRASKPFVPVSCGAIPVELAENELFGHEKGAFTGALHSRSGLISAAEGGTLFLDDVDTLPHGVQCKLMRFLQDKKYRPLGCSQLRTANIRVLAATNIDLPGAVEQGRFRRDLYYRLNVVTLRLPPLRERPRDILLIARHFLAKQCQEMGRAAMQLSSGAVRRLVTYRWPGNVRELENVVKGAIILSDSRVLHASHLQLPEEKGPEDGSFRHAKAQVVARFERSYIRNLLTVHGGNVSQAARAAKKHRRALWELIRKHGIDVNSFRTPA